MRNKIQVEEATEVKVSNFYHCVQTTFQCFPSRVPGQTDPSCAMSEQWRHILVFLGDSQRWGLEQREYRFWHFRLQASFRLPFPTVCGRSQLSAAQKEGGEAVGRDRAA